MNSLHFHIVIWQKASYKIKTHFLLLIIDGAAVAFRSFWFEFANLSIWYMYYLESCYQFIRSLSWLIKKNFKKSTKIIYECNFNDTFQRCCWCEVYFESVSKVLLDEKNNCCNKEDFIHMKALFNTVLCYWIIISNPTVLLPK